MFGYPRAGLIAFGLKDRLASNIADLKGSLIILSIFFIALIFGFTKALYFGLDRFAFPAIAAVVLVITYFIIVEIGITAPKVAGWLLISLPSLVLVYEILLLYFTKLAWGWLGDPNIGKILMIFSVYHLLIILSAVRHLNRIMAVNKKLQPTANSAAG